MGLDTYFLLKKFTLTVFKDNYSFYSNIEGEKDRQIGIVAKLIGSRLLLNEILKNVEIQSENYKIIRKIMEIILLMYITVEKRQISSSAGGEKRAVSCTFTSFTYHFKFC